VPVEITLDPREIEAALERLKGIPYALQRAVYPAVADVLQGVRNHLADYLSTEVPLAAKTALKAIRLNQPSYKGDMIKGSVNVRSRMFPLIDYDVQPQEVTAREGLHPRQWPDFTFSLRRGERRLGRSRVQGASVPFIARMPSGHLGVYYRTGGRTKMGNVQLKQAYGPTVQHHVATPELESSFSERANSRFPEILARYVDQALAKHGGGS
jgi:hypothetical protein